MTKNVLDTIKCLKALGQSYKGDFKDVDGRIIQSQLDNIIDVLHSKWTFETFCIVWDIHPEKFCWLKHAYSQGKNNALKKNKIKDLIK